jgi:hypothetical protein
MLRILAMLTLCCGAGNPASAAEPNLDARGRLCEGPTPIFPLGIYSVPREQIGTLSPGAFNLIVNPYWSQGPRSTPEFLAALRAPDQRLAAGFPYEKVRAQDDRFIEQYVRTVQADDRLLLWYLFEEPATSRVSVEQGESAYRQVRSIDPRRPILFVDYKAENAAAYRGCYDIFAYDYYPIGTNPIAVWRTLLRKSLDAASPKPGWAVTQAFGYDDPKKDWVLPTPGELRCMAYTAVVTGAQGLLFYAYSQKNPEYWADVERLAGELSSLSAALLELPSDELLASDRPTIQATLRIHRSPEAQTLHLIAVNLAHQTPAVERHFPGVRQADVRLTIRGVGDAQAELVGASATGSARAGRVVAVKDGVLLDSFDEYAVHVYRIRLPGAASPR